MNVRNLFKIAVVAALLVMGHVAAYAQGVKTHTVQRGETVESLARRYGLTPDDIFEANPGVKTIYTGMTIKIPANEWVPGASATNAAAGTPAATNSAVNYNAPAAQASIDYNAPAAQAAIDYNAPATQASFPGMAGGAASAYGNFGQLQRPASADDYRRSSLCLILLSHSDKEFADQMQNVFMNFEMPARYNEHNVSVKCLKVRGKQSKADIDRLLRTNNVAKQVVGRWFNRNSYTGNMDMGLVHDRGGYGAMYADYRRAISSMRGVEMLKDEGLELLQNTYVLVCDMDYVDKKQGAGWAALGMAILSAGAEVASQYSYAQAQTAAAQGNYAAAQKYNRQGATWGAGSQLGRVATAVVADIGGFTVKMNAYLYKLRWDDNMTSRMFNEYWVDSETTSAERSMRKQRFDNADYVFGFDYLGNYSAKSGKTILRSWSNEEQVIRDVCQRTVGKGIVQLAKKYPVFKPRTPYYFDGSSMYSFIGTKEDVYTGQKYEIVQRCRDKKGTFTYKRVGEVVAGSPWNNRTVRFDRYFDNTHRGTMFRVKKSKLDLHNTPGLQLREM
ncbi:MAG: LysM peptidoglycan-binding domain-containing protein [Muribaculaceae bacterium]|nr:LysM peptidoglycan-binding domain-containing protein [Muribaculaceae bacterium]